MSTLTITVVIAGIAAAGFLLANVIIARGGAGGARRALKTGNPPLEGQAPKTSVGPRHSHVSEHATVSAS